MKNQPIENVIRFHLIPPALCDGRQCSDVEREILPLPIKMGGLGIINIEEEAKFQNQSSRAMTTELRERIAAKSDQPIDQSRSKRILQSLPSKRKESQQRSSASADQAASFQHE